ncbi:hypothetical protein GCM10007967_06710 [Xylanimonas ulmi]|uniref:Uncharacterized protein n=1 Tax=Xylanimonas ulmi TaxID=228973 RepID=A0A4Q7M0D0_9MICO|nr:hypothetical protein EV386_1496 [Xylanibacterium ulmi]
MTSPDNVISVISRLFDPGSVALGGHHGAAWHGNDGFDYDRVARTLTLGRMHCPACDRWLYPGFRPKTGRCGACAGTGVGPSGDHYSCSLCDGRGRERRDGVVVCRVCGGASGFTVPATWDAPAPARVLTDLPVGITRLPEDEAAEHCARSTVLAVVDDDQWWLCTDEDALVADARRTLADGIPARDIVLLGGPAAESATLIAGLRVVVTSAGYTIVVDRDPRGEAPQSASGKRPNVPASQSA